MTTYTLQVKGMTCGGCERAIEHAVAKVAGVRAVKADHAKGLVTVEGEAIELDALRAAVEDAGYDWAGAS